MGNKLDPWDDHDLREVEVWSTAVLARRRSLAPLTRAVSERGDGASRDEATAIIADSGFAVIALFLSLAAVQRYRVAHEGSDGPIPDPQLADLLRRSKLGRDAVVHFAEKVARSPTAELRINGLEGVIITAPPGKTGSTDEIARISWAEMEDAARAVLRWLGALEMQSS